MKVRLRKSNVSVLRKSLQPEEHGLATFGGGTTTATGHWLFAPLCSEAAEIKAQMSLEDRVLLAHPGFPSMCKMLQKHIPSCLPWSWGWGLVGCYCAKISNWPKLTTITIQAFPYKWKALNRSQNSYTRFSQCNCCLDGETGSWCFLPWNLPRILTSGNFCVLSFGPKILNYTVSIQIPSSRLIFVFFFSLRSCLQWESWSKLFSLPFLKVNELWFKYFACII